MSIQLSDHFTYKRLLRFTLPSIASMLFTSIYGIVDGFFVSNFVGKDPFTGLNLIMPLIMILGAFGNMLGVGGSALIGMILGEGKTKKANRLFSFLIYFMAGIGVLMAVIGNIFLPQIAVWLGAEGAVYENAIIYGRICMAGIVFLALQYAFQSFLITAEKPQIGLYVTIAAGVTNIVLDALFIAVFHWGIAGAALATVLGQVVGTVLPLWMFFNKKNTWILKLGKPEFDGRLLLHTCANGSSEFLSNISSSLIGMLFNFQLLKYIGNDGVAAYGVIMYVNMIFIAIFFGYSIGSAPIISYHFGAGNKKELQNLVKKNLLIIGVFSMVMFVSAEVLARPLALIFVSYDKTLLEITVNAFRIYSVSFLFCGIGIMGSSLFTALNNGGISALLSFVRTVILQAGFVLLLPLILELNGIWWSVVFAEGIAAVLSMIFIFGYRKKYQYM